MRQLVVIALAFFFLGACSAQAVQPSGDSLVSAQNSFAFDLFRELAAENSRDNLMLAPAGLSSGLSVMYLGARGETESQMGRILNLGQPQEVAQFWDRSRTQLTQRWSDDGKQLRLSNRLWVQEGFPIERSFLTVIRRRFDVGVQHADFSQQPDHARKMMNAWVAESTEGEIRELFGSGEVEPQTRTVLASVFVLRTDWARPFDPQETVPIPFTTAAGEKTSVPAMTQTEVFRAGETDEARILELPYARDVGSMVIVLPRRGNQLQDLEQMLDVASLRRWRSVLSERETLMYLPLLDLSTRHELRQPLEALGLSLPFGSEADFSGITGAKDLMISKIVHQVSIQVDEKGTRAKAATGITTKLRTLPDTFLIDRPFLFFVLDGQTGMLLLMGRVADPSAR